MEMQFFNAILRQNLLKPLGAIINMSNDCLTVNGNQIEFLRFCPYKENEIHQL